MPEHFLAWVPPTPPLLSYQFTNFFQCKKHARFYGRNRPTGNSRDLLVAELLVDTQFENGLLFWRQLLHQPAEMIPLLLIFQLRMSGSPYVAGVFADLD